MPWLLLFGNLASSVPAFSKLLRTVDTYSSLSSKVIPRSTSVSLLLGSEPGLLVGDTVIEDGTHRSEMTR